MTNKESDLEKLFHPESIVIIGVSSREFQFGGSSFLKRLLEAGYPGRLYPVNPRADIIQGLKCYPDLTSLPETPDLAIVCIAAHNVPRTLIDCGKAGIKHIHILTSGFRELGTADGIELERELKAVSDKYDLRVVGPNCMGPYSPVSGLTAWGAIPGIVGSLGVISQSGGLTQRFTELVCSMGIGISKAVSMGNATVLDACDYLEYMGVDDSINVIAVYLENVIDGGRFLNLAREINQRKPIIILKGGLSDAGSRTIASHTGAMGGSQKIWEALFKQTGAVHVKSLNEWVDTVMAFMMLPDIPIGSGVFLAGGGGGNSAVNSDIFNMEGLTVPELSEKTMTKFAEKVPAFGSISGNPLDSFDIFASPEHVEDISRIILSDTAISMIVVDRLIPRQAFHLPDLPDLTQETIDVLKPVAKIKPTVVTVDSEGGDLDLAEKGIRMRRAFCLDGIPAFPSPTRAARTLGNYFRYQTFKHRYR